MTPHTHTHTLWFYGAANHKFSHPSSNDWGRSSCDPDWDKVVRQVLPVATILSYPEVWKMKPLRREKQRPETEVIPDGAQGSDPAIPEARLHPSCSWVMPAHRVPLVRRLS